MIYITIKEAATKWGVKPEIVARLCRNQKVEGATKKRNQWLIPEEATRPQYIQYETYNKNFTFIDLFCGIGGFHQAMSNLGGRCVFACDINLMCQEVYKQNYCPNDEFVLSGDINKAISDGIIPQFDVLCGGFPCQTFSKAGLQNGFTVVEKENGEKDERGQLFYRIMDILDMHPECKYVVLENVRNLADKKDNWKVICSELKQRGFIITEEPIIESPHHYGVPQVRERVYILGIKEDVLDKRRKLEKGYLTRELLHIDEQQNICQESDNCLKWILDTNVDSKYYVSDEISQLLDIWEEFRANVKGLSSPFWIHKAGIGIYDQEQYLTDPDIGFSEMPEWKKELVMRSRKMYVNNSKFIDDWLKRYNMRSRNLIHQKFEWNAGKDCKSIKDGIIQIRQSGIRVKRPNYFPSLVAMANTPIVWDETVSKYRYLTPKESAKLQSFKEDFIFHDVDSVSYRQLGNSVNVKLVELFSKELFRLGRE